MPSATAELRQIFADDAVADDAERGALELAAHARFRVAAGAIIRGALRNMAAEIDHEADRHFRHRRGEARRRACDQDALRARRRDVDVADVDRDAQEGDEIAREREEFGRARRLPVGDDDLAAARGLRQRGRVEHPAGLVDAHLAQLAQLRQRALAVIVRRMSAVWVRKILGISGECLVQTAPARRIRYPTAGAARNFKPN